MPCNRVMVAGVRTVTVKAECFRPTLRGRSKPAFRLCAEHVRQLGGESPLLNLMEVKS